jgi:hypothetical protein
MVYPLVGNQSGNYKKPIFRLATDTRKPIQTDGRRQNLGLAPITSTDTVCDVRGIRNKQIDPIQGRAVIPLDPLQDGFEEELGSKPPDSLRPKVLVV